MPAGGDFLEWDTTSRIRASSDRIFEELSEQRPFDDEALFEFSTDFMDLHRHLDRLPLFARFLGDLEYLTELLVDSNVSEQDLRLARGALAYQKQDADAIPDESASRPWMTCSSHDLPRKRSIQTVEPREGIGQLIQRWPFLGELTLKGRGRHLAAQRVHTPEPSGCGGTRRAGTHCSGRS